MNNYQTAGSSILDLCSRQNASGGKGRNLLVKCVTLDKLPKAFEMRKIQSKMPLKVI